MILDENSKKPEIEYPCDWEYKVIGDNVDGILFAIEEAAGNVKYDVTPSNVSRKGNYYSLNFVIKVSNEESRNEIYKDLISHDVVKMVI